MSARPAPRAKSVRTPKTKRVTLTGADHLCAMLLSTMDGCNQYKAGAMRKYRDRARQILGSPHAFDEGLHTVAVSTIIVDDELRKDRSQTLDQREYHQMIAAIFDADEREMVTASALQLRGMGYRAISEAMLYGAALMYELLKGGQE